MTTTQLAPAAARLAADLESAGEALARARAAAPLAGPGAIGYGRFTLYVTTPAAVDAIAAEWRSTAVWETPNRYVTRAGDNAAAAEAAYTRQADVNGAPE